MFEYIKDILVFNADTFHFLRPAFLWAFIPVAIVALMILFTYRDDKKWKKLIAPALRPYMFTREKRSGFLFPLLAYLIIMSLGILGTAGPSWSKEEVPGAKSEAVLMIALDLSHSMLAEDIQPNRLERAKFKIRDLLDANPGSRVSLYAYAGTAHTVIPMSSDYRIIRHHLEALSPAIMPVQGSNLARMLDLADSTLSAVVAPSTLLLVSDEIKEADIQLLRDFVESSPHAVEFMAMSSPGGAQIPKNKWKHPLTDANGNIVISSLDTELVFELDKHPKIHVTTLTLDNSDMVDMAREIRQNLDFREDDQESEEQWKDMGYVLLILLTLLIPFWFRKGWMIQYLLLPMLLISPSCTGLDSWDDLWYSKDYQGQILYEAGAFEDAGTSFESPYHEGMAWYRAGNYDSAAQAFARDSSANSLYNLGITYSKMGMYDKALEVIRLASEKDPGNAQFEKAIEEARLNLQVLDSLQQAGEAIELPDTEKKKEKLEERKASSKDEELTSDTEVEELPEDGKRVTDEVETEMRKAEEMEEVPENFEAGSGETPQNVLLRGISEDPSEFLKRRFRFQYKKYKMEEIEQGEPW